MGYTYAVQVPVGKEIFAKQMILEALKKYNPGIVAVHAFETFTQIFKGKNRAPKQLRAKIQGYLFVTIKKTDSNLPLGMDSACYYLIKKIPFVARILNQFIKEDEWLNFFEEVDTEPEIQISNKKKRPLLQIVKEALSRLETKKNSMTAQLKTMLWKVQSRTRGKREVYNIPFSLFKLTRERIDPGDKLDVKTLTTAEFIIPHIIDTVKGL